MAILILVTEKQTIARERDELQHELERANQEEVKVIGSLKCEREKAMTLEQKVT